MNCKVADMYHSARTVSASWGPTSSIRMQRSVVSASGQLSSDFMWLKRGKPTGDAWGPPAAWRPAGPLKWQWHLQLQGQHAAGAWTMSSATKHARDKISRTVPSTDNVRKFGTASTETAMAEFCTSKQQCPSISRVRCCCAI